MACSALYYGSHGCYLASSTFRPALNRDFGRGCSEGPCKDCSASGGVCKASGTRGHFGGLLFMKVYRVPVLRIPTSIARLWRRFCL